MSAAGLLCEAASMIKCAIVQPGSLSGGLTAGPGHRVGTAFIRQPVTSRGLSLAPGEWYKFHRYHPLGLVVPDSLWPGCEVAIRGRMKFFSALLRELLRQPSCELRENHDQYQRQNLQRDKRKDSAAHLPVGHVGRGDRFKVKDRGGHRRG